MFKSPTQHFTTDIYPLHFLLHKNEIFGISSIVHASSYNDFSRSSAEKEILYFLRSKV